VTSERPQVLFWTLLASGILFALVGLVLSVRGLVDALSDESFTVSLGGLLFGIGAALLLLAALREGGDPLHPLGSVMVVAGCVVAGWALGGGADEILGGDTGGFVVAAGVAVVGAGVAAGGCMVGGRDSGERRANERC